MWSRWGPGALSRRWGEVVWSTRSSALTSRMIGWELRVILCSALRHAPARAPLPLHTEVGIRLGLTPKQCCGVVTIGQSRRHTKHGGTRPAPAQPKAPPHRRWAQWGWIAGRWNSLPRGCLELRLNNLSTCHCPYWLENHAKAAKWPPVDTCGKRGSHLRCDELWETAHKGRSSHSRTPQQINPQEARRTVLRNPINRICARIDQSPWIHLKAVVSSNCLNFRNPGN